MRIAVAQMSSRAGDFGATGERMLEWARTAFSRGAELVVFPYALLTGTTGVDYPDRAAYVMDLVSTLDRLAQEAPCPLLVSVGVDYNPFGSPVAVLCEGGAARPLMGDGGVRGCRRGFELGGVRFDVAYTYDELDGLLFEESDAQVGVYVGSYGFAGDDPSSAMGAALGEGTLPRDVQEKGLWLLGSASLGYYDGEVFTGSSFALTPWGELAAQAPSFEESLMLVDVDPASEGPLAEPLAFEVYDRPLTMWQSLALGLGGLLAGEGYADVVLALDGRLASGALCILAVDALGPTHVHALLAPSGSDALDRAARELATSLRVETRSLEGPLVRALRGEELRDLCAMRLAAFGREVGAVALSSADKTALALEGRPWDLRVGAVAPFGDVYRTDVIELARLRNAISPVMSQETLAAFDVPEVDAPGTGTSPEGRLELIDAALSGRVDWERSVWQVSLGTGAPELTAAVLDAFGSGELGRAGLPSVIRASARSIAEARRPLGSVWRDDGRSDTEIDAFAEALLRRMGMADDDADNGGGDEGSSNGSSEGSRADMEDMVRLLRDMAEQGTLVSFDGLEGGGPASGGQQPQRGQGRHGQQGMGGMFGPWGNPFSEN